MIDLKPACHQMIDLLADVTDDQLALPTPCTEYTLEDLIDHVDEVSRVFVTVARKDPAADGAEETEETADARLPGGRRQNTVAHVESLGEAWDDPRAWEGSSDPAGFELPNELWGKIALTEIVVHGWDIARATGMLFDLPEETLKACHAHVAEFVPQAPVPDLWGPPVEVPADAPLMTRIAAITGRHP